MTLGTGEVIEGRYEVGPLLARGGMADVHRARDTRLDRWVALKAFRADAAEPAGARRFEQEARLLAALDHRNLVRLLDAGHHGDTPYLVLELIEGPTLADRLRQGPLAPLQARQVARDLARALAYVHGRGVVHRDVKPSNVLLAPDGRALLSDFGIARLADSTRLTATRVTIGTAAYLAPEQVGGGEVTGAADVYALGLVLIEALSGRRPFAGTHHEMVAARLSRDPDIPPGIPPSWARLLRAMTRRHPAARPDATVAAAHLAAPPPPDTPDDLADTEQLEDTAPGASPSPAASSPSPAALSAPAGPAASAGSAAALAGEGGPAPRRSPDATRVASATDPGDATRVASATHPGDATRAADATRPGDATRVASATHPGDASGPADATRLHPAGPPGDVTAVAAARPRTAGRATSAPARSALVWLVALVPLVLLAAVIFATSDGGDGGSGSDAGGDPGAADVAGAPSSAPSTTPSTTVPLPPTLPSLPDLDLDDIADLDDLDLGEAVTPAAACAALDAQKQALDQQKQQIDQTYQGNPEVRDTLKAEIDARKQAIDDQKQALGC